MASRAARMGFDKLAEISWIVRQTLYISLAFVSV
jgi:hypothetical protein